MDPVRAMARAATAITLVWDPPADTPTHGGGAPGGYTYTLQVQAAATLAVNVSVHHAETTCVVTGLHPRHQYYFYIAASNSAGQGAASAQAAVWTTDPATYVQFSVLLSMQAIQFGMGLGLG
jgi:hypothetical protein